MIPMMPRYRLARGGDLRGESPGARSEPPTSPSPPSTMQDLYAGFDLCGADISGSMTINGPAPTILAMFLSTDIGQFLDAVGQR